MSDVLGFTGTAHLPATHREVVHRGLLEIMESIHPEVPERVVTGACVGVDEYIFFWFRAYYPDVPQTVVFPADRKAVDLTEGEVRVTGHTVVCMPPGTSYRQRNEKIVELSGMVGAFWTGQKRSGTYMTMNIARKAGKIVPEYIFGVGLPDQEVRTRYRSFTS
jgi:hypothetical protein